MRCALNVPSQFIYFSKKCVCNRAKINLFSHCPFNHLSWSVRWKRKENRMRCMRVTWSKTKGVIKTESFMCCARKSTLQFRLQTKIINKQKRRNYSDIAWTLRCPAQKPVSHENHTRWLSVWSHMSKGPIFACVQRVSVSSRNVRVNLFN